MDDELEHSPQSWLDDFMQRFSWWCPPVRALPFLNNYFLLGVYKLDSIKKLPLKYSFCMSFFSFFPTVKYIIVVTESAGSAPSTF